MKLTCYLKAAVLLPTAICLLTAPLASAELEQSTKLSPHHSPVSMLDASSLQRREQAVELARSGAYQPAIVLLERLLASDPENAVVYHDLLMVLGWAEQDQKALQLADRLDPVAAPVEVLESLGKSSRNIGEFATSIRWYTQAISRSPDRLEGHLGHALALADSGLPTQALRALQAIPRSERYGPGVLMATAYIHRSKPDFAAAIVAYDSVLAQDAEHRGALRGKIFALQQLRLPAQALVIANAHPRALTGHELAQLHADWAAVQIRWANQTASGKMQTDAALDRVLQAIVANRKQNTGDAALQRRADFDSIVALRLQQRMAAAVSAYEQLAVSTEQIPAYVLGATATAYVHLRQPEKAQELLLRALQQEPDSFALLQQQFYIYVDLEQHQAALTLAETLRHKQPVWLQVPGSRVVKSNPRRLQAEIMAGLSLSFADQLPQAQTRFENLLTQAPHNTDLRHELATVYRRRGWIERALFEYRQVLSIEPGLTAAAVGHAHSLLDRRQYAVADQSISSLLAATPERQNVVQLNQRWRQINRNEYRVDANFGKSSGSQFGSEQYTIDGLFFVKPLAYRWRPFVHSSDAFAEFPEGNTARRRLGAGIEYRSVNWVGSLELDNDRNGGGEPGVQGQAKWMASDAWSLAAVWETQSDAIPLRGHRIGLDADRIGLRLEYRASELQQISVSGEQTEISDGNTRYGWSLQGRQRVVTRPAYKLDLGAEIFASRASAQDVVYFNPRHATSLRVNAFNDWRTFRRYDFAFTQQVNLGFGYYWQDAHGSSPVGSIEYLANIDVNAGLSLHFGVRFARDVYDGDTENATFFTVGIAGTF